MTDDINRPAQDHKAGAAPGQAWRRWCLATGAMGSVVLTVGWVLDEIGLPHYDPVGQSISALGAVGTERAWAWNLIISASGACFVALGVGLWPHFRSSRLGRVGVGLIVLGGAGFLLDGFVRLDTTTAVSLAEALRTGSWHQQVHIIESVIDITAFTAAPFVLGFVFRRTPLWRNLVAITFASGAAIAAGGLWFLVDEAHLGLAERLLIIGIAGWVALVAIHGLTVSAPTGRPEPSWHPPHGGDT